MSLTKFTAVHVIYSLLHDYTTIHFTNDLVCLVNQSASGDLCSKIW